MTDDELAQLIGVPDSALQLPTPALLLDEVILQSNMEKMADWARKNGIALRPHSKSHKSPEIARRQIAAGAIGICCATVREAEMMVASDIPGVLLTSAVAPNKIKRVTALAGKRADFACVVDNEAQVEMLGASADASGVHLNLLVDLDVGHGRTGVADPAQAARIARKIADHPNMGFEGVQAYMGHVQHMGDIAERRAAIEKGNARLQEIRAAIKEVGLAPGLVTGGGTGSHLFDAEYGQFGELQVGSYIFMDVDYLQAEEKSTTDFLPSLYIQATVINDNHAEYGITDAGLKAFATDGPVPTLYWGAPEGASYRFMGDEHGLVHYPDPAKALRYGALVRCVTPHCDPTVNLHDRYFVIRDNMLVDVWPISARGHR